MQATTTLPADYQQQATFDLSKSKTAIAGTIAFGVALLIFVGWFLVQFTQFLRPSALGGMRFHEILTLTPDGQLSIALPIIDAVVAFVLVMLIHEFMHGLFFWWFAGQRPTFGFKRLYFYAAAPPGVYLPRSQYIVVGIAPFVLLTLVGLLLMLIVPVVTVSILSLFVAFNAAGSAGDLVMAVRLLAYSPHTLMQDIDTGVIVYGPQRNQRAA